MPFLLLLESILYFHKFCMLCTSLSLGLSWFDNSLWFTQVEESKEKIKFSSLDRALIMLTLRASILTTLCSLYNAFMHELWGWGFLPSFWNVLSRSSFLLVQISTQCHLPWLPLWAGLYTTVYFSQSSQHSLKWPCLFVSLMATSLLTLECQPHKDRDLS